MEADRRKGIDKAELAFKVTHSICQGNPDYVTHLCFKQAQPKMCHSPKVDDRVNIFFQTS